ALICTSVFHANHPTHPNATGSTSNHRGSVNWNFILPCGPWPFVRDLRKWYWLGGARLPTSRLPRTLVPPKSPAARSPCFHLHAGALTHRQPTTDYLPLMTSAKTFAHGDCRNRRHTSCRGNRA